MTRPTRSGRRDERGSLAPAVPIVAFALLLLGGLAIDGSRQLNARGEAVAFAEEAARAGAQGIDINSTAGLELDEDLAEERVGDYCREVLRREQVTECRFVRIEAVSPTDQRRLVVVTRVETTVETSLLAMARVYELHASAEAKARPYEGVTTPDE